MHSLPPPALEGAPKRWWATGLLWLCAVMLLAGSLWLRWPTIQYPTGGDRDGYNRFAFNTFSYSDIASLFFRDQLHTHPRPYFDYDFEYPVGMGLLVYGLNNATQLRSYMLLSSAVLGSCALVALWLIGYLPAGRRAWLALSPALMIYLNLNWDWWAIVLTVAGLVLVMRERPGWAGVMLGAAVWTKFFPVVLLPLVALAYLLVARRAVLGRFVGGVALISLIMNGPLLLLKPQAWWYFFTTNQRRSREVNLWNLFDRWQVTTATINLWSTLLLAVGMLGLLGLLALHLRRGQPLDHTRLLPCVTHAVVVAGCAAIAWFFFINKVYSPQYGLWIVVLLAAAGAPAVLTVAWGAADLIYFAASFNTLGLSPFRLRNDGPGPFTAADAWYYHYALLPAMVIRETLLLLIIGWAVWWLWQRPLVRQHLTANSTLGG